MKKITLLISIIILAFTSFSQNSESILKDKSNTEYIIISQTLFDKIQSDMEKQTTWSPINLKDYKKQELVAFYIQSYNDRILSTWVDFAYKKMKKFNLIEENSKQDNEFKKLLELPRSAGNSFRFMMKMTKEQIETVGY